MSTMKVLKKLQLLSKAAPTLSGYAESLTIWLHVLLSGIWGHLYFVVEEACMDNPQLSFVNTPHYVYESTPLIEYFMLYSLSIWQLMYHTLGTTH